MICLTVEIEFGWSQTTYTRTQEFRRDPNGNRLVEERVTAFFGGMLGPANEDERLSLKEFPPFRLDTRNQCLWHCNDAQDDERILLKPKPFAVLQYLVEHAGRLVTQDELLGAVWPDTYVQPEVLKRHILDIRSVLGDDAKNPVFIETLPRRGYQFIARVHEDASPNGTAPAKPARGRVVGRDRWLGELQEYLRSALAGQREIVFITGEAGIGKTTLVDEFERRASADARIRVSRGQCVEGYGSKEAYYPVLEALGNLYRRPGGDSVIETLAEVAPTWLVQFPALVKREQREMLHREILGATRERMLREIGEALRTITASTPVLLVLEDLQWVDHSTIDLISALARGRGPAKLMLIGTYRPVDVVLSEHPLKTVKQDLSIHQLCHEIALEPLGEAEISEYLSAESAAELPEGLASLVHQHSEGNPLFMVAALDHIAKRELISRDNGSWQLRVPLEEIDLEVPENLRQMIEAQIERLSPEEQRALEVASVRGVSFRTTVIAVAAALDVEKFEDLCEELSRRQHMLRSTGSYQFPDGTVSQGYEFAHALYREVFYHRQPPGRRAKLHLRIGERLEELYSKHESEVASELAEHFEEASDWPRAVNYLRFAADSATRRYAHREAIAILQHALDLVSRLPEPDRTACEMEVLAQLAPMHVVLVEIPTAIKMYETLIAHAADRGLTNVEARALLEMAYPAAWIGTQFYLEIVERARQLSIRQQDPLMRARTRARCFASLAPAGRWRQQDAEDFRKEFAEIQGIGDRSAVAELLLYFGNIQSLSSEYGEAHQSLKESLASSLQRRDQNPYVGITYQWARHLIATNLLLWGKWGQALQEIETTVTALEKNADYTRAQEMLTLRACVHLHAMDLPGVIAICESISNSLRIPGNIALWHILVGSAEGALGNCDRGLEHLLKAKDQMDRQPLMDDWFRRMPLQAGLTELWLRKGDLARAREEAQCFLKVTLATAERTYQGLAWEANARIAIAEQEWVRAEECIVKAVSTVEGYEVPLAAWRVHGTAAEIYEHAGNAVLAGHHRELGRATIFRLANSLPPEDPLRTTFLSAAPVSKVIEDSMEKTHAEV